MKPLPKTPNLSLILSRKREIREALTPYCGQVLRPNRFLRFVDQFYAMLPKGIDRSVVHESLDHLAPQVLTPALVELTAWRMLANVQRLRRYEKVLPWFRQLYDEWVPVQCVDSRFHKTRYGKVGALLSFTYLAGTPCGMTKTLFWSRRFCFVVARHWGFTRGDGLFPFRNPGELVHLRAMAYVEAEKSAEGPSFEVVRETTSLISHNRDVLHDRTRNPSLTDFSCPHDYTHHCFQCPVGYAQGDRTCPVACHPATFELKFCESCQEEEFFNPLSRFKNLCVNCEALKQLKKGK